MSEELHDFFRTPALLVDIYLAKNRRFVLLFLDLDRSPLVFKTLDEALEALLAAGHACATIYTGTWACTLSVDHVSLAQFDESSSTPPGQ